MLKVFLQRGKIDELLKILDEHTLLFDKRMKILLGGDRKLKKL